MVNPDLTEHLRQLEQQFGQTNMHGDTQVVDRLMGADFTLRVGDAPERSVPRALREDISLGDTCIQIESSRNGTRPLASLRTISRS